ncbi:MAG: hypothetical protein SGILL_010151 [Bacillariaceae sp.]
MTVSPFDLAASHPTVGGATKKKLPDFSSVPDIVVSNTDMLSFSSSNERFSHAPTSPPGINEVLTVTFSTPANMSAFQAFDEIDLEDQGGAASGGGSWTEKGGNIFVPPSSSSAGGILDNFYRPPKLEESTRRLSGLSTDEITAGTRHKPLLFVLRGNRDFEPSQQCFPSFYSFSATSVASSLRRMSWQSIETFDQSTSIMESHVMGIHYREERKKKAIKFMGSAMMLLALCYVIASLFGAEDIDEASGESIPMEEVRAVLPKFLDPFHGDGEAGYHP